MLRQMLRDAVEVLVRWRLIRFIFGHALSGVDFSAIRDRLDWVTSRHFNPKSTTGRYAR